MGKLGTRTFLSYRSDDIDLARKLAQLLIDENWFDAVVIIPPEKIARRREILLVYDYFELMDLIVDQIVECDSFSFLERNDHWASYWTQQELTQWRRAKKNEVYGISTEGVTTYSVEKMGTDEKRLLARLSIGTKRNQPAHTPPTYWSKFARSCFLVQCSVCSRNLVVTQKAIYAALRREFAVTCAWCGHALDFEEVSEHGNFYRKRILLSQTNKQQVPPTLTAYDLQTLLVSNDLPESVRLVKLPGEQLLSDGERVANVFSLGMYSKLKRIIKGDD